MIIDAWAQHPTLRHSRDPVFDSLRRWTGDAVLMEALPVSATLSLMDRACIDKALISAWEAPRPQALLDFLRGHGKRKVLFGTNYPMITPEQALDGLSSLALNSETRDLFLGGNATSVFNL